MIFYLGLFSVTIILRITAICLSVYLEIRRCHEQLEPLPYNRVLAMSIKGLGFKRLVPPPFDAYKGKKFTVLGSWWPSTTGADKSKQFILRLLDFNLKHVNPASAPGTKGTPHFKVQLVSSADPDSTGVGELLEGENFWWVTHQIFSDAYLEDKDKRAKENTEASLAAITAAAASAATFQAKDLSSKSPFEFLWTKETSERGGKPGWLFRCYDVSCPKNTAPYFVGHGNTSSFCIYFLLLIFAHFRRGFKKVKLPKKNSKFTFFGPLAIFLRNLTFLKMST